MAFLLGFISIISSLLLLFMKALTTNDCFVFSAHKDILQRIEQVIDYISVTIEALRVGRSAPRALKIFKNDIHFSAYKSSL
jgi:hypothetical protein